MTRSYDIHVTQPKPPAGQVLGSFLDDGGTACTGIQKLVQRWSLEFLTSTGSMGFHLTSRGTEFVATARAGGLRTELDVTTAFALAAARVRGWLDADAAADDPDDERLASTTLVSADVIDGNLSLTVDLRSLAGTSRTVVLPLISLP